MTKARATLLYVAHDQRLELEVDADLVAAALRILRGTGNGSLRTAARHASQKLGLVRR